METLPDEIIQHILRNSNLTITDVVKLSSVSSKFREIIKSSRSLWKAKYFQRWPRIDVDIVCEDWYSECISRMEFEKLCWKLLSSMSSHFFHLEMNKISSSQLDFITCFIYSHEYGYYYLRDLLIEVNSLPLTQSLTSKYYGNILLKYIHKNHCREVWNNLIQLSIQEQILEKGAIFVTVWYQEYERELWKKVTSELDDIASKVKHHLLQHFPDHPLKSTPEEVQLEWRNKNIAENIFQPGDCKSIIYAINYVLFEDLKYCIAYDFNDLEKKENGIDYALLNRKTNPFVFSVIYESIARRLGVRTDVLELSDDYLLRWKENFNVLNSPSHYIKISANGKYMTILGPEKSHNYASIVPCNMLQAAQRAAHYIHPREIGESNFSLKDALDLQLVLKPFSLEYYRQLSQIYMLHELDPNELILRLKDIRSKITNVESREFSSLLHSLNFYQQIWIRNYHTYQNQTLVVQNRVEEIKFAVGMIVRDRYRKLTGVIYGWNFNLAVSERNRRTVCYKVLVEDGRYDCMFQENIQILHSPPFISHASIGRFFDEYCLTYFKPNKELQTQYPQDMEALQRILKKDRQT